MYVAWCVLDYETLRRELVGLAAAEAETREQDGQGVLVSAVPWHQNSHRLRLNLGVATWRRQSATTKLVRILLTARDFSFLRTRKLSGDTFTPATFIIVMLLLLLLTQASLLSERVGPREVPGGGELTVLIVLSEGLHHRRIRVLHGEIPRGAHEVQPGTALVGVGTDLE
jgi:hypothetical protein